MFLFVEFALDSHSVSIFSSTRIRLFIFISISELPFGVLLNVSVDAISNLVYLHREQGV